MAVPTPINLQNTTPAAASGRLNVQWQADTSYPRNVSASIPLPFYAVTWGVAIGQPPAVANDVTPHYLVPRAGLPTRLSVAAKTAPTGADLIFDIWKNGTSIFGAPVHLAAGQTQASSTAFASGVSLAVGDLLTFNVNQIGSTVAGQDLTVQLTVQPS